MPCFKRSGVQQDNRYFDLLYQADRVNNLFSYNVRKRLRKASENQPEEGEMAWLAATLEECLEALGILLYKAGAEPSGAFSFWRLARAN